MFKSYLKAVSKCPYFETKLSKKILKLIFLTKAIKIRRYDYSSKNMSNEAFYYSVSIIVFEFQLIDFSSFLS